ncbi:MAG: tetratricopeptide repeat protein [Theionarchaea archaeon]|nr:tetratricopeptide repeat protein [Theionarchaea archaeon]
MNPEYVEAWKNEGNASYSRGEYKTALEAYERATKINPKDADAWYKKGNALFELKRDCEALEAYEKA